MAYGTPEAGQVVNLFEKLEQSQVDGFAIRAWEDQTGDGVFRMNRAAYIVSCDPNAQAFDIQQAELHAAGRDEPEMSGSEGDCCVHRVVEHVFKDKRR